MLTTTQLQAIKAEILADAALSSQPMNSDGHFAIAAALNELSVVSVLHPTWPFVAWRTTVPTADAKKAMVWTEFISRSAGERDAWQFMLSNGIINAADPNVRQGIQDIFSGPNGAQSRGNLVAIAKRMATRAEAVLATGTGTDVAPGTLTFEGTLSFQDVEAARNS